MMQIPGIDYSKAKLFNFSFDVVSPNMSDLVPLIGWIGKDINLIQNIYFQPVIFKAYLYWIDNGSGDVIINDSWSAYLNLDFFAKRYMQNNYISTVTGATGTITLNQNFLKYNLNQHISSIIIPIEGILYQAPPKIELTGSVYSVLPSGSTYNLLAHIEITGYIWPSSN